MNLLPRLTNTATVNPKWVGSPLVARYVPSPNVSARATARHPNPTIDSIILHATGGNDLDHALHVLADPAREASCHYVIARDGEIIQMVDDTHKAWHAGISQWNGRIDLNPWSLGIELVSDGHTYTEAQYVAVEALLACRMAAYDVKPEKVLGHHEVAWPLGRKWDPSGRMGFDWERLTRKGLTVSHCRALPLDGVTPLPR
ncbi:MAG: N-acetylmuramoyl-L-alanine amidase [Alphaproteobacteria bacterium]